MKAHYNKNVSLASLKCMSYQPKNNCRKCHNILKKVKNKHIQQMC